MSEPHTECDFVLKKQEKKWENNCPFNKKKSSSGEHVWIKCFSWSFIPKSLLLMSKISELWIISLSFLTGCSPETSPHSEVSNNLVSRAVLCLDCWGDEAAATNYVSSGTACGCQGLETALVLYHGRMYFVRCLRCKVTAEGPKKSSQGISVTDQVFPPPSSHCRVVIAVWLLMMLCFQAPLDSTQNSKALSFITRSCCGEISSSTEEGWDCAVDHSPIRRDLPMTSSQAPLPEPLWSATETSHDGTNCHHTCSAPFLKSVHLRPRNNFILVLRKETCLFSCF